MATKTPRKSKYGSRENYLKVVKAKAAANKLYKRGITSVNPAKQEWRIDRYGRARPQSRALGKAMDEWHEYTHFGARAHKLTKAQLAAVKKTWKDVPTGPTVKNGMVLIGKGLSLKLQKDGRAQFVPQSIRTKNTLEVDFATDPDEARRIVEAWARTRPDQDIYVARTETMSKRRSMHHYSNDKGGIDLAMEAFSQYVNESISPNWHVSFMFGPTARDIIKKNQDAYDKKLKEFNAARKRKSRAKKRGMRTGRGH